MKPTFDFTTLLVRCDSIPDYREAAEPAARDYHCLAAPGPELYPYAEIDSSVTEPREMAQRIAACINACHVLDLPPGIPAGAVAALVTAARELGGFYGSTTGYYHVDPARMEALRAALAPFTADPAPQVSPPGIPIYTTSEVTGKPVQIGTTVSPYAFNWYPEEDGSGLFICQVRQGDKWIMSAGGNRFPEGGPEANPETRAAFEREILEELTGEFVP